MRIVMVKKRLQSGAACDKCVQAEQMLRTRGLWEHIDEVVWAVEGQPDSEGMRLGREYGVDLAPFFIVHGDAQTSTASQADGQRPRVYTSALKLVKEQLGGARSQAHRSGSALSGSETPDSVASGSIRAPTVPPGDVSTRAEDVLREASHLPEGSPQAIVEFALRRFGSECGIAFSGAEDVALIDMAVKTGLPFSVFCLETGRLHPETYRFLEKVRQHYGIELALHCPNTVAVQNLVRKKGLFSFYDDGHHECCGVRKVEPLGRALSNYRAWITGQRKDQSPTRSELDTVELDVSHEGKRIDGAPTRLVKFNPLANWSSKKTWSYIRTNEVPYNELHDRGYVSIGCEPCTRAIRPGEHERAGRWWWEEATQRECGLHTGPPSGSVPPASTPPRSRDSDSN